MASTLHFNIHDIVNLKIVDGRTKIVSRDLDDCFSYFESGDDLDPDLTLNIGRFTPSNRGCYLVDHKYYVKDNYLYCTDQQGRAKWEFEIYGIEYGHTTINFSGRVLGLEQILLPNYLPENLIIRPLLDLQLFKRGYVTIHGLGMERDGSAIVLASRGGAHKTRIAMEAIRCGDYRVVGDDKVILGHGRELLSYPLFFKLLIFRSENSEDENISSLWSIMKMMRYILSSEVVMDRSHIIADKSCLKALLLVSGRRAKGKTEARVIEAKNAATRLVRSSQMEMISSGLSRSLGFVHFLRYMLAYSYVFPESRIARYWRDLESCLGRILSDIPVYEIELPLAYDKKIFDYLRRLLEDA